VTITDFLWDLQILISGDFCNYLISTQ